MGRDTYQNEDGPMASVRGMLSVRLVVVEWRKLKGIGYL